MEISSFLGFDDDHAYSTAILSCRNRWNFKFKPEKNGCSQEEWTLQEVILCIIYMVAE